MQALMRTALLVLVFVPWGTESSWRKRLLRLQAIRPRRVGNTPRTRSLTQGTGSSARSRAGSLRSSKKRAANGDCPTDMSWERRSAAPGSPVCVTGRASCTPRMPATVKSTGKGPHLVSILLVEWHGTESRLTLI